ncbi:MAG: hypothetical protein K1060chlam4_00790 [Candidatus Anoxychlamydiales bacterium]|nr:hypothetical protein [Candidatus Anoxychlamydiales bacterium]
MLHIASRIMKKKYSLSRAYFYFILLGILSFSTLSSYEIPEDLQAAKYVTVIEKNDGFGSQLYRRMSAIAFAKVHNKTYIHLPFTTLQHNYDNDINLPSKLESFVNIGMGSLLKEDIGKDFNYFGGSFYGYYISLATDLGRKLKEKQDNTKIYERDRHHHFENLTKEDLNLLLSENLNHPYIYAREDYRYYVDKDIDAYYNKDVRDYLKKKYYSTEKNIIPYFRNDVVNVAVHVRRGDVGIGRNCSARWSCDEHYLSIMNEIRKKYSNVFFHVYSEGGEQEFVKFKSRDTLLHLNEDIKMTFHALVTADILITSKSAFSFSAALLSDGIIYYTKFWYPKLCHWNAIEK